MRLAFVLLVAAVFVSCSSDKKESQSIESDTEIPCDSFLTDSSLVDETEIADEDTFPTLEGEYLETIKATHFLRDCNADHLLFAQNQGLEYPFFSDEEFLYAKDSLLKNKKLVKLEDNKYFKVKDMTHSHPYLTPEAVNLLYEIGERFHANLKKRRQREYAFYINSALRTDESQRNLHKRNKNATRKTSSHIYGTTFDISRLEFHRNCDSTDVQYLVIRRILEQTVREIRKEKCCLVMKENKQLCLHITVIQ